MRGEPDFRTPAHIGEAAVQALQAGRTGYPDNRGEIKLREAVAAKLQRDNRLSYDPASEILVTTGATMGLSCALTALLEEGDEVLLPDPIYDAYQSPDFSGRREDPLRARAHRERTLGAHARRARGGGDASDPRSASEHAVESGRDRVQRAGTAGDRRVRRAQEPLADQRRDL